MNLGEHLATGNRFMVQDVVFKHDLHEGYLGAFFQCATGACQFDMHLTLAKWDVMRWLQTATFGYDESPSILLSPSSTPHVQPLEDSLCLMQEWFGRERRLLRVTDLVNSMTPSQRRHQATWLGIHALLIHSHSPYMVLPNMFPFPTPVFPTPSLDLHWMLRLRLPWLPLSYEAATLNLRVRPRDVLPLLTTSDWDRVHTAMYFRIRQILPIEIACSAISSSAYFTAADTVRAVLFLGAALRSGAKSRTFFLKAILAAVIPVGGLSLSEEKNMGSL